jgi:hypothetical protein
MGRECGACVSHTMLVLEPIFEADLPPELYAYRPGRNAGSRRGLRGSRSYPSATFALFDRGHRLSGHPGKGLNFSFQGERLDGKFSVLDGVPIALGSCRRPHASGRRYTLELPALGTAVRSAWIWRGIATPGAYPSAWG